MGHRKNVYVIKRVVADGGEPPNRTVSEVTAEVRVFYPPGREREALYAFHDAVDEADVELKGRMETEAR